MTINLEIDDIEVMLLLMALRNMSHDPLHKDDPERLRNVYKQLADQLESYGWKKQKIAEEFLNK